MIVDLHKYLVYGSRSEMHRFFTLAQRAGFLEFIGLSHKKALELPDEAKTIISAIKIARQHTAPANEIYHPKLDPIKLAESIVAVNKTHESLLEEQRILNAEIARISAFGSFSREELDSLEREGKRIFQFFVMKSDLAREIALPPEVIYIATEYDLDYFVAINKEPKQYPKMIEITIDRPVNDLRKRLATVQEELEATEKEIHDSAKALPYLHEGLNDLLNEYHLQLAKHDASAPLGETLFAIEAWVPSNKISALRGLISNIDVEAEEIAIESRDVKPTYMENKGAGKIGEDLVHVYDTPASTDTDPSTWVLFFFALFFAIIISDAGYGLIYLLIGLILKWKIPKTSQTGQRMAKLTIILGSSCIVWGVLTASFFGIEIGPDNPFRRTSFLHAMAVQKAEYHMEMKDDVYNEYLKEYPQVATATDGHDFLVKASTVRDGSRVYDALDDFIRSILLELSLFIGTVHICLSFMRYLLRNWYGLGWIFFLIGGYLYFPSFLDATSFINFLRLVSKPTATFVGEYMLYGGLIIVFILAFIQKRFWGAVHELTNGIQIFGDVLSYLRLFALALAGMIMADTFNKMGMGAGLFAGIFIILLGHLLNITLAVQSGVIHGLRLNFLEWYHYSFEGGGRVFNPLRLRKK
jgi:V/A-type H+-transporting ATPase subunit I